MTSKHGDTHSKSLSARSRNAAPSVKDNAHTNTQLYKEARITQMDTAENIILASINRDGRLQKSGIKQYDKHIAFCFQKTSTTKRTT